MGEHDGGDVRVIDPCVDEANTGVVDDNDGVGASRGDVENNIVRVIVCGISTVSMFRYDIFWAWVTNHEVLLDLPPPLRKR